MPNPRIATPMQQGLPGTSNPIMTLLAQQQMVPGQQEQFSAAFNAMQPELEAPQGLSGQMVAVAQPEVARPTAGSEAVAMKALLKRMGTV